MLTKKQVSEIQPEPFKPLFAHTRFRDGEKVGMFHPAFTKPRLKRSWSFEGTHKVTLKDGSIVERPGSYVPKMKREA